MQEIKYTDEELQFVVDHEEERKPDEQITSNNCQYEFQKPSETNAENKRVIKYLKYIFNLISCLNFKLMHSMYSDL